MSFGSGINSCGKVFKQEIFNIYMKGNKRGLSDVVTTVLIILLVLAAIVLIWVFIKSQLDKTTKTIDLRASCLQLSIEPVSCKKNTEVIDFW